MPLLTGIAAGALVSKCLVAGTFDPVFFVGLVMLFILMRRVQLESKAFVHAYHGFLFLVAGQCIALSFALSIGFLTDRLSLPVPQEYINIVGLVPLVLGIALVFDLIKESGIVQGIRRSCARAPGYQSIDVHENIIVQFANRAKAAAAKHIPNPFLLEVALFYSVCFCNSIGAYHNLFHWLDVSTSFMAFLFLNALIFLKTLLVLILIQWSKQYTDCMCPSECTDFFFPGDFLPVLAKYVNALVYLCLGSSLLGQSIASAISPKLV